MCLLRLLVCVLLVTPALCAGQAAQLKCSTSPNAMSGTGWPLRPYVVYVGTASGALVSSYSGTVTVSVASGPGALSGTQSVSVASVTTPDGSSARAATFSNLILTGQGTYQLTFSATGLTSCTTPAFAVGASFHLSSGSPARGIGLSQPGTLLTDFDGTAIAQSGAIDVGALQFRTQGGSGVLPAPQNFGLAAAAAYTVTWTYYPVGGETGQQALIQRCTNSGSGCSPVTIATGLATDRTYTDTTVARSIRYCWQVLKRNPITLVTSPLTTVQCPAAVQTTATPVPLAWDYDVPTPAGVTLNEFQVQRCAVADCSSSCTLADVAGATAPSGARTVADGTPTPLRYYTYALVALGMVDGGFSRSAASNTICVYIAGSRRQPPRVTPEPPGSAR